MQALRLHEGSKKPVVETIPIPELGPEDVLVKVKAAGLAPGVFNMMRMGMLGNLPATLGHEAAGVVEKIGDQVANVKIGSRVRIHSSLACRNCEYCLSDRDQMCVEAGLMGFARFAKHKAPLFEKYRDGGLAEYIRAPYWLVDELPDHVSFNVGAKIHEVATAYCTVKRAGLQPGSTVIVTSPTGAVGSSIMKIAHLFGIRRLVLVGRSKERLEAVARLTNVSTDLVATDQLSKEWAEKKELAASLARLLPHGADAVIDLTPTGQDFWQVFAGLKVDGTLVHLGANFTVIPLPAGVIMQSCWKIVGIRNHSRGDVLKVISWLQDKHIDAEDLITHTWPFSDIDEAIARLLDRSLPMWMSVVTF